MKCKSIKQYVDGVKKLIIIASGKGGVGKSSIASLISQKLSKANRVGLIDADIYGPSIPTIFGVNAKPEILDNKFIPLIVNNISLMSISFLLSGEEGAVAWRGPMVVKALFQLLSATNWKELDYLIIDTPPGTGDVHLSILENYHIDGAVFVTTNQTLAAKDVARSIDLYRKFDVNIYGIIENMIYGENSAGKMLSDKYGLKILAKIPFMPEFANACDNALDLTKLVELDLSWLH